MTNTNQFAVITPGGGVESLTWKSRPVTDPGPGEVRIRMRAASLNFRDLLIARGQYPLATPRSITPLSDGAGIVEATGPGVHRLQVGQRVVANFMRDWVSGPVGPEGKASSLGGEVDGILSECVILPEHSLAPIPDSISFAEAAAIPCAGVTAWNALHVTGRVRPGDTVLVQGSGGVSVFALQLAVAAGARVFATSSSDSKLQRLRELGAEFVVNYQTNPDWSSTVLEYTGGQGVDHVVEVGGTGTFAQSLRAVRMAGTVSVIGVLSGVDITVSLVPFLHKHLAVNGIFVGSRSMLEETLRSGIKPVIDRSFAFTDAVSAYGHLASGEHFGKVILEATS